MLNILFLFCRRIFASCLVVGALTSSALAQNPSTEVAPYGTLPTGELVQQFTLRNGKGMQAKVIEFGAIITELAVPDKLGKSTNVVLAANSLESYLKGFPAAAVMGRYGGRIGGGRFMLEGHPIEVTKNSGQHHIHGGQKHFGKLMWQAAPSKQKDEGSVELQYTSADGEEGFPGTLRVNVTYSLTNANELTIEYRASTDKTTVINLTNHAYFNLAGAGGDVLDHELQIEADRTARVNKSMIPTGELVSVDQTALDFRRPHRIGERIASLYGALDGAFSGYDHTYELRAGNSQLRLAAKVTEPTSGRVME